LAGIADQELSWLEHRVETELASRPTAMPKIRETMRMLVSGTLPFMRVTRYVFLDALQHVAGTGQDRTNLRMLFEGIAGPHSTGAKT
jgi:hypothetical protein